MVRRGRDVTKQGRMSMTTRKELTEAIGARYRAGSRSEKQKILDEFVALTGCHRKHAIRALNGERATDVEEKGRSRIYDEAARQALILLWEAADGCVAISGSGKVWYGRFSQKPHQKYPLQGS